MEASYLLGRREAQRDAMTLMPLGRAVTIGDDIDGVIVGINITENGVQYQVAWWNGRSRSTEWLFPSEVLTNEPPTLKIGFK